MRHWGPRRLDDDLTAPAWLLEHKLAAKALRELVSMGRVQNRILAALELLRTEVLTRAKPGRLKGRPRVPWFPDRDEVDQAAKALALASKKVERVLQPFASVPVVIDVCLDPAWEVQGEGELNLSTVTGTLDWAQAGMGHLRALIRRKNGLRDILKAYVTQHARDFGKKPYGYHDRLVADLIDAATYEARKAPYKLSDHKDWRTRHKYLLARVEVAVLSELRQGGYKIAQDADGKVTTWRAPTDA